MKGKRFACADIFISGFLLQTSLQSDMLSRCPIKLRMLLCLITGTMEGANLLNSVLQLLFRFIFSLLTFIFGEMHAFAAAAVTEFFAHASVWGFIRLSLETYRLQGSLTLPCPGKEQRFWVVYQRMCNVYVYGIEL